MPKKKGSAAVAKQLAVAKAATQKPRKVQRSPIIAAIEALSAAISAEGANLQKIVVENGEVQITYSKTDTYQLGDPRIPKYG